MPVLEGKELRIVGFLCNWCSYGGADTAGVARAGQPTDLRIIRVPCSGRIDPLFIVNFRPGNPPFLRTDRPI